LAAVKAPLSWLRDFAPFDLDPVELGRVFDDLGMVVEGIERVGEGLDGVVLGRVLEVASIEGARVRRTRVDVGEVHGRDVEIVCGAANVEAGHLVPVAVVGTTLPGDFTIGRRKVMGIVSNGMICSERELGLGDEHAGIMVLPDDLGEPGEPFAAAMGIEPDIVYDLAIETNRPDANCIAGIARDAAAKLGLPFTLTVPPPIDGLPAPEPMPSIDCPPWAPRFGVTILDDVTIGPSPAWLARRLELVGMRPISNLVDISNYVMLELGQPTHPYDIDRLPGRTLGVREAREGEVITTLDDVERTLGLGPSPDVVITDGTGEAVGIAGVMGGASSEIHEGTRTVLLEAAHFDRLVIAKTSKRLGLRSEASARFERGVDPLGIEGASARFVQLAATISGARAVAFGVVESEAHTPWRHPIRVRTERVNAVLGTALTDADVRRLLTPIGFAITTTTPGVHDVTPPSFRLDADQEADVIEEIARHHGYTNIPRTVPASPLAGRLTEHQRMRREVREVLVGLGLDEAATGLLLGPGDHAAVGLAHLEQGALVAQNPLAKEESVLRRSLRPGLLRAVGFNLDRRLERVPLFETGTVFHPGDPGRGTVHTDAERHLPDEHELLTAVVAGARVDATDAARAWSVLADALRLEDPSLQPVEDEPGTHPTRTARVLDAGGTALGLVGEIDPDVLTGLGIAGRVALVEIDLRLLGAAPRRSLETTPVSRFPSSDVDLAFVVPDAVAAEALEATLRAAAGELLEWVRLFDVYRGAGVPDGHRSLAYRLRFVAQDRTLTDAEVATARASAIDAVATRHGGVLR
jgi:phenylalanyl-tRNA synthetase beta chain